jgi:hypothetical protein
MALKHHNPGRLLLFGKDPALLGIRAMVLRSAGMTVDIAINIDEVELRIADANSVYDVLICCHTITEAECKDVIAIAGRTSTVQIMLECLLLPSALIDQVFKLIAERRSRISGV